MTDANMLNGKLGQDAAQNGPQADKLAETQAKLVEQIHENGRLADKLNRITAELAFERGFLANARARADQAERDRDEWQAAAEMFKAERDRPVGAMMWQDPPQEPLQAGARPSGSCPTGTFDDRLAASLMASEPHADTRTEVDGHRWEQYDVEMAKIRGTKAAVGNAWARIIAVIVIAVFLCATLAVFWAFRAHAHPAGVPQDGSEVSLWFDRQHNVDGGVCCGSFDAFYLGDDDWVMTARGYRVKIGAGWYDVPSTALRDTAGGPNPTGQAIIWYAQSKDGAPVIWCFAPGTTF